VPITLKSGSFNLLKPSGPVQVCTGIALPKVLLHVSASVHVYHQGVSILKDVHSIITQRIKCKRFKNIQCQYTGVLISP